MTSTAAHTQPATAYRLFEVAVLRSRRLSPSFTRFTFAGSDLDAFAAGGFDQRIKLVLPLPGVGIALPEGEDWFARWRLLPDRRRNPIRTYTARAVRQEDREVDVDIVLHGEGGPASRWATHAQPGDRLALLGPNARFGGSCGGIEFDASAAERPLLLVGDETAVPAIASILERLPASARGEALLEVPHPDDRLPLVAPPGVTVTWLPRGHRLHGLDGPHAHGHGPHGQLLVPAVRAAATRLGLRPAPLGEPAPPDDGGDLIWDVPEPDAMPTSGRGDADVYAWLAGEAAMITSLRRHLVHDLGVDRHRVAFMGYWRQGRAES
jgi:NADPH-dependent ferric siderophore reductase